jgi:hypothetical protein
MRSAGALPEEREVAVSGLREIAPSKALTATRKINDRVDARWLRPDLMPPPLEIGVGLTE